VIIVINFRFWKFVFFVNLIAVHFEFITDMTYMQQNGIGYADHACLSNQNAVMHGPDTKNPSQTRRSISRTKDGHFCEVLCFLFIS